MAGKVYTYKCSSWLDSKASQKKLLGEELGRYCPKFYYHILFRDNSRVALALEDCPEEFTDGYSQLLDLVKHEGKVFLLPAYVRDNSAELLEYADGRYSFRGAWHDGTQLKALLDETERELLVVQYTQESSDIKAQTGGSGNVLSFVVLNETENDEFKTEITDAFLQIKSSGKTYKIGVEDGFCSQIGSSVFAWNEAKSLAEEVARYFSLFRLLQIYIRVSENGAEILSLYPSLEMPASVEKSEALKSFELSWESEHAEPNEEYALQMRKEREFNEKWETVAKQQHRTGMRGFLAHMWADEKAGELEGMEISEAERAWYNERGFLAYRRNEVELNDTNYSNYVSDYDYFWVNRINSGYQMWIADKLASRYALDRFKSIVPEHYMIIDRTNGRLQLLPLQEFPEGKPLSFDTLFELAQDKQKLAIKKTHGTHGQGFNLLESWDGIYCLNGEKKSKKQIVDELFSAECRYIVTEYIVMHDWLKRFYPKSLNTLRVNAFRRSGEKTTIGACFLKLGHSKGGFTDNINTADGGIIISVDKTNGRIIKPEFKRGNVYTPCDIHPDTGVPIEGVIPHFDMVLEGVKRVCSTMPQLEYFGFDIAITPESFKIVEINVFPDYTKYVLTDRDTQEFLKYKVMQKYYRHRIELPEIYRTRELEPKMLCDNGKWKFKFSVIVPLYNVEKYVRETLDSVINQVLGFKENIQLILVNDGSTDKTEEICREYERAYPNNIVYISKPNGGVSSARNEGLKYAEGKYVGFIDGDDRCGTNELREVWDFFEEHYDEIDVVACRRKKFEGSSAYSSMDFRFHNGKRVIDIQKEPQCSHLDVCSTFVKNECALSHRFAENLSIGEDSRYINEIITDKCKYGVVPKAVYYIRVRKDGSSLTQRKVNVSVYTDTVKDYYEYMYAYSIEKFGRVIPYIQYLIIDGVRYRASSALPDALSVDICEQYRDRIEKLIRRTDIEVLETLKNGSVGAIANVLKIYDRETFGERLKLKNDRVYYDAAPIGSLNTSSALVAEKIEVREAEYAVSGTVLLPFFVTEPSLLLRDEKTGLCLNAPLQKASEQTYKDMYGENYYTRYNFSISVPKSGKKVLSAFLKTDNQEIGYKIIAKKNGNAGKYIANGLLSCGVAPQPLSKKLKRFVKRLLK